MRYDPFVTHAPHQPRCSKCRRPFEDHLVCAECGGPNLQPDDPGRWREFCSSACKQRAYRRRHPGKSHSGTRYDSPGARQRRAEREAWAEFEAAKERERQRSERRRAATPPPPRENPPGWVYAGDLDAAKRKKRAVCRLLWERAAHRSTPAPEAELCKERAEEIRRRYGL